MSTDMRMFTVRLDVAMRVGEMSSASFSEAVLVRLGDEGFDVDLAGPDELDRFTFWVSRQAVSAVSAVSQAADVLVDAVMREAESSHLQAFVEVEALEVQGQFELAHA